MSTAVHVTHEAVRQSGGIGTVLRGLLTSRAYAAHFGRNILLGPLPDPSDPRPLGPEGELLYDGGRGIGSAEAGAALGPVEARFGVRLVYGRRRLSGDGGEARPEVLLVDVSRPPAGLDAFKYRLYERFGLESLRYETNWEYEQYLRMAGPGFEGVRALLGEEDAPVWVIAHEFMGLGTAFETILSGDRRFKTAFYAHEVATVRRIVEERPGRDLMFYNLLRRARGEGGHIEDFFGPQDGFYKHALVSRAWVCDAVLAVGDKVVEELRFLGPEFARRRIDLVYNGVSPTEISLEEKERSKRLLREYARNLLGWEPGRIFTHVTRLVPSKGLWRDLQVLERLDPLLARRRRPALFVVLATETGPRAPEEVEEMVRRYGWPLVHREGYPDLTGREAEFDLQVRAFNARSRRIKVLFVNQFGWSRPCCGPAMPEEMDFSDLRKGSDAEFGQSIYEPFGIAGVEPLGFGAVCVLSDVCGCLGFLKQSAGDPAGLVVGGYTRLERELPIERILSIGAEELRRAEAAESGRVAGALAGRLPSGRKEAGFLLKQGYAAAAAMSWERVVEDYLLPALKRAGKR